MLYETGRDWLAARHKRVLVFGMSGLGKTHVSNILRDSGDWFHYSVDYRIGTRYMGELIDDNLKREAMKNAFLADLLLRDSVHIGANITFEDLSPLSTFMGKPGDPAKGGIGFGEYERRQEHHLAAEIAALLDAPDFVRKAEDIYGYTHFVCDSGGSICEVLDPQNPDDKVMTTLSQHLLPVWIEGGEDHAARLAERFDASPKPMYFNPEFLAATWSRFLAETGVDENSADPDAFMRAAFRRCLEQRLPRYRAMADHWGVRVNADEIAKVRNAGDFDIMIARAIDKTRPA
ncbi:MAG: ATPase [Paracoccaceae bacterium]